MLAEKAQYLRRAVAGRRLEAPWHLRRVGTERQTRGSTEFERHGGERRHVLGERRVPVGRLPSHGRPPVRRRRRGGAGVRGQPNGRGRDSAARGGRARHAVSAHRPDGVQRVHAGSVAPHDGQPELDRVVAGHVDPEPRRRVRRRRGPVRLPAVWDGRLAAVRTGRLVPGAAAAPGVDYAPPPFPSRDRGS